MSIRTMLASALFAAFAIAGSAGAQTCAAPGVWMPPPSGGLGVGLDLCTASDEVALYCDFLDSSNKNDGIWQLNFAAGFTSTAISVGGSAAGFNPVIYLYNASCASGSGCVASGDAGNPLALVGTAPGAYFLGASAAPSDASGACGPVTITTNGYVPVSLQAFTIE